MSGQHLKLEGMGAFDAAVHCASVAAAERQHKVKKSYSTGNLGAAVSAASNAAAAAAAGGAPAPGLTRAASQQQLSTTAAAPAPPTPAANASAPLASGPSAAADGDRRRRFHEGHRTHSHTFHVRSTSSSRDAVAASPPPAYPTTGGSAYPGTQPTPASLRNIINLLGSPGGAAGANGGILAGPSAGGVGGRGRDARGSQAAAGVEQSARSMTALTPPPAARLKQNRFSSRNITELTDVPEIDETVAIGSLSGKFKLHLKAFSRKVARSLSFTNKGSGGQGGVGSSGAASSSSRSPALTPRTAAMTVAGPGTPPNASPSPSISPVRCGAPLGNGSFTIPAGASADASGVGGPAGMGGVMVGGGSSVAVAAGGSSSSLGPLTSGAAALNLPTGMTATAGLVSGA
jgi:hypothetical protein